MADRDLIIPVGFGDSVPKPSGDNIANRGARRLVKLVPTPYGSRPSIWTKPASEDVIEGQKTLVHQCVVLLSQDPIQTVVVSVPRDFYEKLPDVPVEW